GMARRHHREGRGRRCVQRRAPRERPGHRAQDRGWGHAVGPRRAGGCARCPGGPRWRPRPERTHGARGARPAARPPTPWRRDRHDDLSWGIAVLRIGSRANDDTGRAGRVIVMAKQDNLDPQTRDLVRFAAAIAQGYEPELRERVGPLRSSQVPVEWVEELLLQSVLFVGYPRALIAFSAWRRFSGVPAPREDLDASYANDAEWTRRGEETCATVYGDNYQKLRDSVRQLHPAIDAWMITEGYGRTLARPGLDLLLRELC